MRISQAVTALMAAGLLAATTTGAASPAAAAKTGGCTPTWKLVSAPAPAGPLPQGLITGVAVDSAGDAWFAASDAGSLGLLAWAYHWDGRSFGPTTTVPEGTYMTRTSTTGEPFGGPWTGPVSFDSPDDGWMIGMSDPAVLGGFFPNWAAHWSGGRWTIIPLPVSPDPASVSLFPDGLTSVSPTDAWAAGEYYNGSAAGALIEHWDGTQWSIVPNPASSQTGTQLNAITAVSATDIWAVGQHTDASGTLTPFAEHWDGTAWTVVAAPAGAAPSQFTAVSADGPSDAWAVGNQTEAGTANSATGLVEHWNGHTWGVVTGLPHLGNRKLLAVYAASPSDVWATVYGLRTDTDLGVDEFLHWDGTRWATVPVPGPHEYGLNYDYAGIAGTGPGNIWAAGSASEPNSNNAPLIAHLSCG